MKTISLLAEAKRIHAIKVQFYSAVGIVSFAQFMGLSAHSSGLHTFSIVFAVKTFSASLN